MKDKIDINAVFGEQSVAAQLSLKLFGSGNYAFVCGDSKGHFLYTTVWGWRYFGDPLELDDIQILIDLLIEALGKDGSGLEYTEHIVIPYQLRRFIMNRDDYFEAMAVAPEYYLMNQ